MVAELWNSRELIWQLFSRELRARYRQSILGYIWAIIPSVMLLITFSYINSNFAYGKYKLSVPYPVYALTGLSLWQLFSVGLTKTTLCLEKSQAIITKVNFCRETLVFSAFMESVFEFVIRLALVVPFFLWYDVCPAWTVIFVPFILVLLALLTIGLGFFLTLLNGVFRDIGNGIPVIMPFLMIITPVAYPPLEGMPHQLLNYLNPVSPFIIAARDLTFFGEISNPLSLAVTGVMSLLIFLMGWRFFRTAIPRIAERV